ncbi:MAG: hypothetical protein R8M45_04465 [Ghiorsea sp.]
MKLLSFREFLIEGGNAFDNVVKINQENVAGTLAKAYKLLLPKFGITKKDIGLIGSTGKKNPLGQSGDIDMLMDIKAIFAANKKLVTMDDLIDFIHNQALSVIKNVRVLKGIGIVTMAFPIENVDGKQEGEMVQYDLMLSSNVKFQTWSMFSPAEKDSPYKGLVRNSLLGAISHYASLEKFEDGSWSRYLLHLSNGLSRVKETNISAKGKLLKNPKIISRGSPTQDPDEVIRILLGDQFSSANIMSFEDIWHAFTSSQFAWKKYRKEIAKRFAEDLGNKNYPVPNVVAKYL